MKYYSLGEKKCGLAKVKNARIKYMSKQKYIHISKIYIELFLFAKNFNETQ